MEHHATDPITSDDLDLSPHPASAVATVTCSILDEYDLLLSEPFVDEEFDSEPAYDRIYAVHEGNYLKIVAYLTRREIIAGWYFPDLFRQFAEAARAAADAGAAPVTPDRSAALAKLRDVADAVRLEEVHNVRPSDRLSVRRARNSTPLSSRLASDVAVLESTLHSAADDGLENPDVRRRIRHTLADSHRLLVRVLNPEHDEEHWAIVTTYSSVDTQTGYLVNNLEDLIRYADALHR